jgi:hypothetical protein
MTQFLSEPLRLFPGMACTSTEFFSQSGELKMIHNGSVKDFTEISFCTIQILKEAINQKQEILEALKDMHPESEMQQIKQFILCRFGGLDYQPDMKDGVLQDGEYWACPNHGICKHEGVLCKLPNVNGHRLNKTDVVLMQLSSTTLTNEVIAEHMKFPFGSFHKAKRQLYEKLSVQTKHELVKIAIFLNIIQP